MKAKRTRPLKKKIKHKRQSAVKKAPVQVVKKAPVKIKKGISGAEELVIEKAKFSYPDAGQQPRPTLQDLPYQYDRDRIVLQVRDPWWIHAYWEVSNATLERLKNELKDEFHRARKVLRVYDVSHIVFNGRNAHRFFDIQINEYVNSWYIDTQGPGRSWCVDLGLLLSDGRFITIVRSNTVYTPLEGPSWIADEEWMVPEDMFARLYGMGFGLGRSSPVGKKAWQERIGSPGMASMASPVKKIPKEKRFWLAADCELILYGATEPDAKVTIQGKPIKLRQDGTFTLRFVLGDGKQIISVKAVSSDNTQERSITPIVTRETK